ncbi:MAG: winged helix-turn-helix domain-containing protein [Dehalococcoidales bacterium]|nr:winged helix-turn-helix domain-containing protein [Dehalococcoidales bacterium]
MGDWTFITNHGLVLATIAKHPNLTAREIGDNIGVTERTAHRIIMDLEAEGYITKTKAGRQNKYKIHSDMPIKDEMGDASAVGELLVMLGWKRRTRKPKTVTP